MRKNRFNIALIILAIMTMVILPVQAFAADKVIHIPVSESNTVNDDTPPADRISGGRTILKDL